MLAGIINTIIMALGIATGNVSSNVYKGGNVFNEVESQKVKKAVNNEETTLTYTMSGEWHNNNYINEYRKYYLDDYTTTTPVNSTYVLNNMIIYNSTYAFEHPWNDNPTVYATDIIGIYKLINVYNGTNEFDLNLYITQDNTSNGTYYAITNLSTDESLELAIDQTMTANSFDNILSIYNNASKTTLNQNSGQAEGSNVNKDFEIITPTITLAENETKYLCIYFYLLTAGGTTDTHLTSMTITSTYITPTQNVEIVDIPGLMYTVISLPFSFISTAFNLTIFPNTPYAVNFSNLFMVLLAAFILMWIIRKVFH